MAVPPVRATVEVEIANASDFCELASHALAGDVFDAPALVTPGLLWHYRGAMVSCRLHYRRTRDRMTIRNSVAACRWFARIATGWHVDPWGRGGRDGLARRGRAGRVTIRTSPAVTLAIGSSGPPRT